MAIEYYGLIVAVADGERWGVVIMRGALSHQAGAVDLHLFVVAEQCVTHCVDAVHWASTSLSCTVV